MAENLKENVCYWTAIDGPFDKPNRVRRVQILREADLPGFIRCRDLDTNEIVTTSRDRIKRVEVRGEG